MISLQQNKSPVPPSNRKIRLGHRKTSLFHNTNEDWNVLKLNQTWVVGSLSQLFRDSKSINPFDWENYYYRSGEERKKILSVLPKETQDILEDFTLPITNPSLYYSLSKFEREINTKYGRTIEDLQKISSYFFSRLKMKPSMTTVTLPLCLDYVVIRVIDETFIGFIREIKTLETLRQKYPQLIFRSVSSTNDSRYAIDAEVFKGNTLLIALQIKSSKYLNSSMKIVDKTKEMNVRKNKDYEEKFKVPVQYVYADRYGYIENKETFNILNSLL